MDKRHSSDIVSKTIRMSTHYSPTSKAAPSLPESPPAYLSQASIPHPGFKGHKPSLFLEGEGQLDKPVVNKANYTSGTHLLIVEMAPAPFTLKPAMLLLHHSPDPRRHESHCMDQEKLLGGLKMGVRSLDNNTAALLPPVPCPDVSPAPAEAHLKLIPPGVVESDTEPVGIGNVSNGVEEGSYLAEPSPVCPPHLSGLKPYRRLLWKPPDMEELKWHQFDVIRSREDGMSRSYSPRLSTTLTPIISEPAMMSQAPLLYPCPPYELWDTATVKRCADWMDIACTVHGKAKGSHIVLEPFPNSHCLPSSLRLSQPWFPWKLPDAGQVERYTTDIVKTRNGGMSSPRSPGPETALMPSAPSPSPPPTLCCCPWSLRLGRQSKQRLLSLEMRRLSAKDTHVISTWSYRCQSPGPSEPAAANTPLLAASSQYYTIKCIVSMGNERS
jgi:hypothetical protein